MKYEEFVSTVFDISDRFLSAVTESHEKISAVLKEIEECRAVFSKDEELRNNIATLSEEENEKFEQRAEATVKNIYEAKKTLRQIVGKMASIKL